MSTTMSTLHSCCTITLQHQPFFPQNLSLNTSLRPNFLTLSLFGKVTLKKINIYALKPEDKINKTRVTLAVQSCIKLRAPI